jgi:predicted phosphohydrolase
MKIDVMSDLHLDLLSDKDVNLFLDKCKEHSANNGKPDLLLLAGDIGSLRNQDKYKNLILDINKAIGPAINTVSIQGNHDFWHSKFLPTDLEPRYCTTGGGSEITTVLYHPGWFDANETPRHVWPYWPDFRYIGADIKEATQSITKAHKALCKELETGTFGILMTHHFPVESTDAKWMGSETNGFFSSSNFVSSLKKNSNKPKLWVHGHTHDPMDYVHPLGMRVYCNPLGYKHEGMNDDFWNRVRIEL